MAEEIRTVVFEQEASAFQELLSTSRTILTLASGVLIGLIGFIATRAPDDKVVPVLPFVFLGVTIFGCLAVMLRGLNDIKDNRAKISIPFYRTSYFVVLFCFSIGFALSARFVISQ